MTRPKILLVDDNDAVLRMMQLSLERNEFDVVAAANVTEALNHIVAQHFDVLLTDLHMPDATGLDFLKNVRAMRESIRQIPVLVVTEDVMTQPSSAFGELGFAGLFEVPAAVVRGKVGAVRKSRRVHPRVHHELRQSKEAAK